MPKNSLKKSLSYIKWYSDRGIGNNRFMDFEWLRDKFLPALASVEKSAKTKKEKLVLSDGYYHLGGVYDIFLQTTGLAIEAYRKSIKTCPLNAAAHRELGICLIETGKYKSGINHLKIAARLWPEDDYTAHELRNLENDPGYRKIMSEPLGHEATLLSRAMELILTERALQALDLLKHKRNLEFRVMRASAYASIDMNESFLEEWEKIAKLNDSIYFTESHWFFLTDEIWNKTRIWEILQSMAGRFEPSMFFIMQGLENSLKAPKKRTKSNSLIDYTPTFLKYINKKYALYCRAQSARVRGDIADLKRLKKKYPAWKELDSFIRKLQ